MNESKQRIQQSNVYTKKKKVSSKLLSDHNLGCKFAVGAQSILAKNQFVIIYMSIK